MSRVEEDAKENLLIGEERGNQQRFEATQRNNEKFVSGVAEDDDLRPSSSRVKKVLNWDGNKFTMDERHKRELRDHHIKD